ncbi:MAG TPA: aromatic ring-hydroxylating dioxygenase subunit alpha [Steroidobacteraceae bacterium]|nr:aromatic ring-hydroxylating dioxygenase subunit alpha [Steroidobacteraceae bacterium]
MATQIDSSIRAALARTLQPFAEARTLPGAVYTSEEVFRLEQSGIFARQWLCVGRESDIPSAGDYFLRDIGGNSVIFIRGRDGGVRAFYNVCRHRGSKLLDAPCGNGLSRVVCPYHAWSYNIDGTLQNAPQMGADFRKEEFPLVSVRVEPFHGFLFANLDAEAEPLAVHFRELPDLSRFRMADLVCGKRIEYDVAANWKLICENYSECYHCAGAHPQLHRISEALPRSARKSETGDCFNGGPMMLREGVATMSMSGKSDLPTIPGLTHEDCRLVHYYVVYPNLLLSPHPDYVLTHTAWPVSPDRTHIVCEWLVTEEAVEKHADTSDIVEFWDVTNRQDWALCERTQAGVASRGYRPGPYQPTEDCVHTFDRWYATHLSRLL